MVATLAPMSTADILAQLEADILNKAAGGESMWADISQKLRDIRNDELFRAATDERTGKALKSFEQYLRKVSALLRPKISTGSVSTIKAWLAKFDVYVDQLGYDDVWLQDVGSHGNILLRAAAMTLKGHNLEEEDRPLQNNGVKLGRHNFKVLCDRIHDNIVNQTGPENAWGVADTIQEVNKLIGSEPPVAKEWDVLVDDQNLVKIQNLKFVVGGYSYDFGAGQSVIPLDDFMKITKGPHHTISGLPS